MLKRYEYYVHSPKPYDVEINGVVVPAYKAGVVWLTYEEANAVKKDGWSPRRKDADAEQGTDSISDAASVTVEQMNQAISDAVSAALEDVITNASLATTLEGYVTNASLATTLEEYVTNDTFTTLEGRVTTLEETP